MDRMSTRRPFSWWPRCKDAFDFQAEIQAHLELEADRLRSDGLDPDGVYE